MENTIVLSDDFSANVIMHIAHMQNSGLLASNPSFDFKYSFTASGPADYGLNIEITRAEGINTSSSNIRKASDLLISNLHDMLTVKTELKDDVILMSSGCINVTIEVKDDTIRFETTLTENLVKKLNVECVNIWR